MPPSENILDGLAAIANGWRGLAIAWHAVFAAGFIALLLGWRPARRLAGALVAIPLACVSALAWLTGNPFNGTVFAIIAAGLLGLAVVRLPGTPTRLGAPWLIVVGCAVVAFGWTYPHFLEADTWAAYLYAAPLGLIPCPTLSAAIGVALVVDGLGSRGWSLTLALSGTVYGLIGWLRLRVGIDAVLLAGAVTLGIAAVLRYRPSSAAPTAGM